MNYTALKFSFFGVMLCLKRSILRSLCNRDDTCFDILSYFNITLLSV